MRPSLRSLRAYAGPVLLWFALLCLPGMQQYGWQHGIAHGLLSGATGADWRDGEGVQPAAEARAALFRIAANPVGDPAREAAHPRGLHSCVLLDGVLLAVGFSPALAALSGVAPVAFFFSVTPYQGPGPASFQAFFSRAPPAIG